ncbi:MAG: DUF2812 domain-containing protein, partial [Lachnospiraceae bacterium]|nr:DUF2812 domain-containing protein [Lachnospiraceae bacterium]
MSAQYKTSMTFYSAWNYEKEIEDLNKASEQGWQLVRGGCFHSRFVKNPDVRYRYQLDFRRIEDMGRYIELFREQGWEYINSTFNGWHYFRKLYDPSKPEEAYEIFTDRQSIEEMNGRWARIALGIAVALALFAILYAIRLVRQPDLPYLIRTLTFAIESALLLRGVFIMRNPDSSRSRRGDSAFVGLCFAVIILGSIASITLEDKRPHITTSQRAASISRAEVDSRWGGFEVSYKDNYYLSMDFKSDKPMTVRLLNEAGDILYTQTATEFHNDRIRLKLPKGHYLFSMDVDSGFDVSLSVD